MTVWRSEADSWSSSFLLFIVFFQQNCFDLSFLCFYMNFRVIFFLFLWRMSLVFWWRLHWICRLLWVVFHFPVLILPTHERGMPLHFLVPSLPFFSAFWIVICHWWCLSVCWLDLCLDVGGCWGCEWNVLLNFTLEFIMACIKAIYFEYCCLAKFVYWFHVPFGGGFGVFVYNCIVWKWGN